MDRDSDMLHTALTKKSGEACSIEMRIMQGNVLPSLIVETIEKFERIFPQIYQLYQISPFSGLSSCFLPCALLATPLLTQLTSTLANAVHDQNIPSWRIFLVTLINGTF